MAGRGLVGIGCPGGGVEAGDVVGVGRANDGGVSWVVDFLRTMSASTLSVSVFHTRTKRTSMPCYAK